MDKMYLDNREEMLPTHGLKRQQYLLPSLKPYPKLYIIKYGLIKLTSNCTAVELICVQVLIAILRNHNTKIP